MRITRRDFLKCVGVSATALGLSKFDLIKLEKVFAAADSPPVIWLQASGCTGDSVSLLNWIDAATGREIDEVLLENISLKYHPTVMAAAGQLAIDTAKNARSTYSGTYILVVEGSDPTGESGNYCHVWEDAGVPYTAHQAILDFSAKAKHILAVGTCAAFGGIPAAAPNPTTAYGLTAVLPKADAAKVINLPGCPAHPDWIMGTIVSLLGGVVPVLDPNKRPKAYYGSSIHPCYRGGTTKSTDIGQLGCFLGIGCRKGDCDAKTRLWNNGINWCVRANTPCIGCTDPAFPGGTFYTV
ncbi:MAG: hydrogenase small subunit [Methanobacteriota archaeon]